MTKKIQIKLDFRQDLEAFLRKKYPHFQSYRILSKGLDARGAARGNAPTINYQVELSEGTSQPQIADEVFPFLGPLKSKPIIVGAGPAGLFCALRLLEYGIPSRVLERGEPATKRMVKIARFWRYGELDKDSNVCYGEGGAGLFSDGKLMTRVKSPYVSYVMKRLVDFGAPPDTAYFSDPHLGSNKIRKLITQISAFLQEKGCEISFNAKVVGLLYDENDEGKEKKVVGVRLENGETHEADQVILATGHSAKEVYRHLQDRQVAMKAKSFSLGIRIEHPRKEIDRLQYGSFCLDPRLGAARYRVSHEDKKSKRGTYSFCMCPGGYVLSSGTDKKGIVTNGMSNFARNSPWSNAALVVSVNAGEDFCRPSDNLKAQENVLEGMDWQHEIEKNAFMHSLSNGISKTGKEIPAMTVKEFLQGQLISKMKMPRSSTPSGTVKAPIHEILPDFVFRHLQGAILQFDKTLRGFGQDEALILAPETRTSSPVTILRDKESLESLSHKGLYPCGEGAGYAGGITSAAVDGIRVAMSIIKNVRGFPS